MSTATLAYAPPAPKETPATVADVIGVKTALTVLLLEETNLMDAMQIPQVGALQERKLKLTGLLERYMRYLNKHRDVAAAATAIERIEFKKVTEALHRAMKRNYDTLLVARAVNSAIVKCVTQTMTKKDSNPVYNANGAAATMYRSPISITLNQTI